MSYVSNQPDLRRLKQTYSEASKRTVFFVGSGPSTEVGVPGWSEMADKLLYQLNEATPSSALNSNLLSAFHDCEIAIKDRRLWDFFSLVELNWPQTYEDFLSEQFDDEKLSKLSIPSVYKRIWKMRNVSQVLTLNLDGLISRAYDAVFQGKTERVLEYPGTSVLDSRSYFLRNYPVILNLHGSHTQRSTWVMNKGERERLFTLMKKADYKSFLRHVFETCNVIFLGVDVRDVAISPIVEDISAAGLLQSHYWITPDISTENYTWCQRNGVRVVTYSPDVNEERKKIHSSTICSILDEIESFRSLDRPVILPERPRLSDRTFKSKEDLIALIGTDHNEARELLDARVEHLGQEHGFDGRQIEGFIREYSVPLELTSILGTTAPYSLLGSVTLSSQISITNSSSVWLALQDDGQTMCAVKSLSGQAFKDSVERESFRRGIESIYQLSNLNDPVAPRYIFHTNVPLSVGMEYISGSSLQDFVLSSSDLVRNNWLSVFQRVCRGILSCHTSDAEVLHRDIKPKNIIFSGAYVGCDSDDFAESAVRFINFDMSWHKFSTGNSKSVSADEVGYYAPEQRYFQNSDTPRTSKTDVYMLGMVLLYIISEAPPPEGGSALKDWPQMVSQRIGSRAQNTLVKSRISRLLSRMTLSQPDQRPDLQSVISELDSISMAKENKWDLVDPDLFLEKALIETGFDYIWDDDALLGRVQTPRQIELSLAYIHRGQRAELRWMRQRDEGADRKNFSGRLGDLAVQIRQQLRDFGWEVEDGGAHHSQSLLAQIRLKQVMGDPSKFIEHLQLITGKMMAAL